MILRIKAVSLSGYQHETLAIGFRDALDDYEFVKELGLYKEVGMYNDKGRCVMHWEIAECH